MSIIANLRFALTCYVARANTFKQAAAPLHAFDVYIIVEGKVVEDEEGRGTAKLEGRSGAGSFAARAGAASYGSSAASASEPRDRQQSSLPMDVDDPLGPRLPAQATALPNAARSYVDSFIGAAKSST